MKNVGHCIAGTSAPGKAGLTAAKHTHQRGCRHEHRWASRHAGCRRHVAQGRSYRQHPESQAAGRQLGRQQRQQFIPPQPPVGAPADFATPPAALLVGYPFRQAALVHKGHAAGAHAGLQQAPFRPARLFGGEADAAAGPIACRWVRRELRARLCWQGKGGQGKRWVRLSVKARGRRRPPNPPLRRQPTPSPPAEQPSPSLRLPGSCSSTAGGGERISKSQQAVSKLRADLLLVPNPGALQRGAGAVKQTKEGEQAPSNRMEGRQPRCAHLAARHRRWSYQAVANMAYAATAHAPWYCLSSSNMALDCRWCSPARRAWALGLSRRS